MGTKMNTNEILEMKSTISELKKIHSLVLTIDETLQTKIKVLMA